MINAKEELLEHIQERKIKCAAIRHSTDYFITTTNINLPINYSEEELEEFLNKLDFRYDSGYGSQELEGTVWYEDNTWSDRREYDGSEWWKHNELPEIPDKLKR